MLPLASAGLKTCEKSSLVLCGPLFFLCIFLQVDLLHLLECPVRDWMPIGWPAAVLHWQALCPCVSAKAASWRTVVVGSFLALHHLLRLSQVFSAGRVWHKSDGREVRISLRSYRSWFLSLFVYPPHPTFSSCPIWKVSRELSGPGSAFSASIN